MVLEAAKRPEGSTLIGQGRTAEIWQHEEATILKLYRNDIPVQDMEREYEISQYVHSRGVPTPQPLGWLDTGERRGIVYQQIQGPSLLKLIGKAPWKVQQYGRQLAGLHCELHAVEAGEDIGRQKEYLRWNITAAPMLGTEEKTVILAGLEQLPEGRRLCHGDFHPDNVLLDGQLWVIDWMTGIAGEPAADAARSWLLCSVGTPPPGSSLFMRWVLKFIRLGLCGSYTREYLRLSGYSLSELERWIVPVAAARLNEGIPVSEKEQLVRIIRKRLQAEDKKQTRH